MVILLEMSANRNLRRFLVINDIGDNGMDCPIRRKCPAPLLDMY